MKSSLLTCCRLCGDYLCCLALKVSDLLIAQGGRCFYRVVAPRSMQARGQRLFHLWHLCAKPDTRTSAAHWAPAEGEGGLTHRGWGLGAFQWLAESSEGHGCHPASRTITHCDRTHTRLGMNEHAGPNPNKTISLCCSCNLNLQKYPTIENNLTYRKPFT